MKRMLLGLALSMGALAWAGCGPEPEIAKAKPVGAKSAGNAETKKEAEEPKGDHTGWWCEEHGVVESECSMCQKEVFKKLKKEDLCPKHPDRAKHQCFICQPELWEKNKLIYEAKYGSPPPEPIDNQPAKK